jgi:hypothetical protein
MLRSYRVEKGIQAGYAPEEWLRIQDLLLTGAAYTPQNLRTRIDLLFGHYYLLREENRRKMELADRPSSTTLCPRARPRAAAS